MKPSGLLKKLRYPALGLALLCLLGWFALREEVQLVREVSVSRAPLTQYFSEEGKTRLRQRYIITAPVAGVLQRVELEPGDTVTAGQTLALIAPLTSGLLDPRSRAQADAEIRAGQSQQAAANQRIAAAQSAHRLAQANLQRARPLLQQQTLSQQSFDELTARSNSAAAELAAARADAAAAAQRVAAARATLAQEGRGADTSSALAVTAPVSGTVISRALQSSTPVTAGQVLMAIGDIAALEIEAEVLSTDAVQLRPNMPVHITRWGGEGILEARVLRVEPGAFTKISALGVEEQRTRVIVAITSPQQQWATLGDGYRVELDFVLQHKDDALQVPTGALFRSTDNNGAEGWALYRIINGRAQRTPVKIGLFSATAAEIIDGVNAGDAVILQPDDRIRDGSRVKPH